MTLRRILALSPWLLLWPTLANAAPSHTDGCVSTSTVTCTLVSGATAHDGAIFGVVTDTGISVSSFTDSETSSSCTVGTAVDSTTRITPVYCLNLSATAKTFTATLSGSSTIKVIAGDSYSGLVTTKDKSTGQHQTTPGTGSNAITSASAGTASFPGELVWAMTVNSTGAAGAGTITAGTGFTTRQTSANLLRTEDLTQGAAASVTGTFTSGNAGDSFNTVVLSIEVGALASKITGFAVLNGIDERASKITGFVVLCATGGAGCPSSSSSKSIFKSGPGW